MIMLATVAFPSKRATIRLGWSGQGYPKLDVPEKQPDYARGKQLFANNCALCVGTDADLTPGPSLFEATREKLA